MDRSKIATEYTKDLPPDELSRLAKVGLAALIDEATGYQYVRFKEKPRALRQMLDELDKKHEKKK